MNSKLPSPVRADAREPASLEEPEPALDLRLARLAHRLQRQARAAGLQRFRYCARPCDTPKDRRDFWSRLAALEVDARAASRARCATTAFALLRELALLGHAPADLPLPERQAARALITEALLDLR